MVENRKRLVDATKRLLQAGTTERDAVTSMTEVGLSESEAASIVQDAKATILDGQDEKTAEAKEPVSSEGRKPVKEGKHGSIYSASHEKFPETLPELGPALQKSKEKKPELKKPYHRIGITEFRKISPVLVSEFDRLIEKGGLKKGDVVLLSGGTGSGKTIFAMQSLYNAARTRSEKGIFITLGEPPERIKENMMESFGWDIDSLESKGLLSVIKLEPLALARAIEANFTSEKGDLYIEPEQFTLPFLFELPFKPDRLVIDSISAISTAFAENRQGYTQYLLKLFEAMQQFNSINLVIDETPRDPLHMFESGIENFLADGIIAFYGINTHNRREHALEILKLRSSSHARRLVPYKIMKMGFEVYADQQIYSEG